MIIAKQNNLSFVNFEQLNVSWEISLYCEYKCKTTATFPL